MKTRKFRQPKTEVEVVEIDRYQWAYALFIGASRATFFLAMLGTLLSMVFLGWTATRQNMFNIYAFLVLLSKSYDAVRFTKKS
jgi:hypothetical protein